MIISESIREWARKHDLQETLMIMGTGETIVFREEERSTRDSIGFWKIKAVDDRFEKIMAGHNRILEDQGCG